MKKIITGALLGAILVTGASADTYIKTGAGSYSADVDSNPSTVRYELAIGADTNFYGDFYFGGEAELGYGNFEFDSGTTADNYDISGNFLLGYTLFDSLNLYGKVGYSTIALGYEFTDGSTDTLTGTGLKYGAGIDYKIWKNFSAGVEYTTAGYELTNEAGQTSDEDINFDCISANIKFRF